MSPDLPTDWTVVHTPEPLESEWRALETRGFGTPFQSYDWVRLFHEVQGGDGAVFVCGRSAAGELQFIAALRLRMGALTWFGQALNNYNMPLIADDLRRALTPEAVERIWSDVRGVLGGVSASVLRRQPGFVGGESNPFAHWNATVEPTSAYALTLGSDWESFYESLHSPATRKTLRKKERWLAQEGPIDIHRISGAQAVRKHAELLLRLKSDQVHASGGRNNLASGRNREFLVRFAAEHPERARIYAMTQNDVPIALAYRIENGSYPILYQMAYEPGPTARHSPGRLLLNRVIEDAISEGHRALDFAVGDEPYKMDLCDMVTPMTIGLAAHNGAGHAPVWAERAKLALKRRIKARQGRLGAH